MKKKTFASLLSLMVIASLTGCGAPNKTTATTTAVVETESTSQTSAGMADNLTTAETSTESEEVSTVTGVVIDASMNSIAIQTTDGQTLSITYPDGPFDTSGLKNGIQLGKGVTISYTGKRNGTDTSKIKVTAEKDAATKTKDADALAKAGEVILALENNDLKTIASDCIYPIQIGLDGGSEIKSEEEMNSTYKAEDIITDELVKAVTHVNLFTIEETKAGLVLAGKEEKPNMILSKTDDGWKISGINYADSSDKK